nr:MAG TPA: Thylakoid soluble phosphoprotein TSP9 [Caudoviricetes sp.]
MAVLPCMRWRSSAPSPQFHETDPITGKGIKGT